MILENVNINVGKLVADLDRDPSNASLRDEEAAYVIAYNNALLLQERFLKQRAKVQWLKEGDNNSAFFHKAVKSRVSRSRIDVVSNSEGVLFENDQVPIAFTTHYEVFLGQPGVTQPLDTLGLFPTKLNDNDALYMVRNVSEVEVKEAMFSMGNEKSPGPDGYTAAFFKDAWDVVGNEVVAAVREFFSNGNLLKELNHTELMHNYHLDRGVPRCAFKVDIQKAYDTVDWDFLKQLVNLCFADDLFLFAHGDVSSATVIMEALEEFKQVLGLVPSLPKSTAYFCNVLNHIKLAILQILPFAEGHIAPLRASMFILPTRDLLDIEQLYAAFFYFLFLGRQGILGRVMRRAGLSRYSKVSDVYYNGTLVWPADLLSRYPILHSIPGPSSSFAYDQLEWRNRMGLVKLFSVNEVWQAVRFRDSKVDWVDVVWFANCIPRQLNLWLIIKKKLKIQDSLTNWDLLGLELFERLGLSNSRFRLQWLLFFNAINPFAMEKDRPVVTIQSLVCGKLLK
ncbi:hypothetical protein Tco_0960889 [Tanacetum coccineum]